MKRPNILLITSDQQHWTTLGSLNPHIDTPNLDRLAQMGMRSDRAYCPNPTCTPTRSSIITGLYPSQHGAWTLGTKLDERVHTVGADFTAAGYESSLIGKAHFQPLASTARFPSLEAYPTLQDLDFWRTKTGDFYGFNHIELARNHTDEAHVGQHYALWLEEQGVDWKPWFQQPTGTSEAQYGAWNIPEEYHTNSWIAERTNAHLSAFKDRDQPFFLWASFFDPHPSYCVPEPWASMYAGRKLDVPHMTPGEHDDSPPHIRGCFDPDHDWSQYRESGHGLHGMHPHGDGALNDRKRRDMEIYYGMVSFMDQAIGRILDHLDELGLTDDTLVIFTSDHGHYFGQHGLVAKGPFHYEDGIRVPFIARQPGVVPAGTTCDAIVNLVDVAPTILSHCGIEIPYHMTGVDQMPVLRGEATTVRDHCFCEFHHDPTTVHLNTYIDQRYKLTVYAGHDHGECYDLQDEPGEITNLWDRDPTLRQQLITRMLHGEMQRRSCFMPRIASA